MATSTDMAPKDVYMQSLGHVVEMMKAMPAQVGAMKQLLTESEDAIKTFQDAVTPSAWLIASKQLLGIAAFADEMVSILEFYGQYKFNSGDSEWKTPFETFCKEGEESCTSEDEGDEKKEATEEVTKTRKSRKTASASTTPPAAARKEKTGKGAARKVVSSAAKEELAALRRRVKEAEKESKALKRLVDAKPATEKKRQSKRKARNDEVDKLLEEALVSADKN